MSKELSLSLSIAPDWKIVKSIRAEVGEAMRGFDSDLIYASKMTTSELIENAIKHTVGKEDNIEYELTSDGITITITVSNRIFDRTDLEIFESHIARIRKTNDSKTLYLNRIKELMKAPETERTRLGLFRIVYEGEFEFDYKFENERLAVTAIRKIMNGCNSVTTIGQ